MIRIRGRDYLMFFFMSWMVLTLMWKTDMCEYQAVPKEAIFTPTDTLFAESMQRSSEERGKISAKDFSMPPAMADGTTEDNVQDDHVKKVMDIYQILKIIFTGIIGAGNLLGGLILLWQKILGKR